VFSKPTLRKTVKVYGFTVSSVDAQIMPENHEEIMKTWRRNQDYEILTASARF